MNDASSSLSSRGPGPRCRGMGIAWAAVFALLLVLAYEARLVPRLSERFMPGLRLWTTAEPIAVATIRGATRRQLDTLPPVPRLGDRPGLRLEAAADRARRTRPANTWANACLAAGVLTSWELTGDPEDQAALRRFADRVVGLDGRFLEPLHGVEQAMVGPALLALSTGPEGGRYRSGAVQLADFLLRELRRTSTGTLPYSPDHPEICLVDTLAMTAPFLAAAEAKLARPDAPSLAAHQLLEFTERAVDPVSGLPWHAYSASGGPAYGICGWTRGVGWYALGLAETLRHLPADHPSRPRLVEAFDRLVTVVARHQQKDGTWRWCLSIPDAETDTSGTALIAWAVEVGVRSGVLPPDRLPLARLAIDGVIRQTDDSGVASGALGECQAIGQYPRVFGAYPWVQGPLTAAIAWSSTDGKPRGKAGSNP